MPALDMSDGLLEPIFQDYFEVIRRIETISNKGRSITTPRFFRSVMGVVTSASGNDLKRLGDYQIQGSEICIVTKFKLQGPSKNAVNSIDGSGQPQPQYQPDLVRWSGSYYLVIQTDPYQRYGVGFIQAILSATTYLDEQPEEGIDRPNLDFSNSRNSGYIPLVSA